MPITALPVDDPGFLDLFAKALGEEAILAPLPSDDHSAGPVRAMLAADDDPGDAALIVSTSGSTGTPKGVRLSAAAIRASAEATHRRLGGPAEWTLCLPLHYVAGAMVAARALTAGTRLVRARRDLSDLAAPRREAYISLVPTQLARALSSPATTRALAAHRTVLLGGAAAPDELVVQARAAGITVTTTYGMSETCGGCVYDGAPLDTTTVTLDETGRIDLAGPMVFSGYHGRPDLTAESLVDGTVRTRDRGAWVDGRLQILGRIDDVIVSGGVNVDLAALERLLVQQFPGAVVVGVPDPEWGTRIVTAGPIDLPLSELRARLAVDGPARPRGLLRVDSLPQTSSGKIDRQALIAAWESNTDKEIW